MFIDVGAGDGLYKSVSMMFEDDLNWTGICIEGDFGTFSKLERNRIHCVNVFATTLTFDEPGDAEPPRLSPVSTKLFDLTRIATSLSFTRINLLILHEPVESTLVALNTIDFNVLSIRVILLSAESAKSSAALLKLYGFAFIATIKNDVVMLNTGFG